MDGEKNFMSTLSPFLRFRYVQSILVIIGLMGGVVSGQTNWTAYNDCVYSDITTPSQYIGINVTTYGIGEDYTGSTSGTLLDKVTGSDTGVTVELTEYGTVNWQPEDEFAGTNCDPNTDAYATFHQIADMIGVIYYSDTEDDWWVRLTFTGLDPSCEYTFATSSNRNDETSDYANRYTRFTLEGTETGGYSNASTSGVIVNSEDSVSFSTGWNTSNGYVARWTGIRPGADGSFSVKAETHGAPYHTRKAYAFSVFKLEEHTVGPVNQAPEVEAGSNRLAYLSPDDTNVRIQIAATVTDDGLPTPDSLSMEWTVQSSPPGATVQFDDDTIENPMVSFDALGEYVLHLEASDGEHDVSDTVTINVNETGCPLGDIDGNCFVDLLDLKILADWWLDNTGSVADLDGDSIVNGVDYALLARNWLVGWGALRILLDPSEVNDDGAQWSIDGGGTWHDSGITYVALPEGNYTIDYKAVATWNAPAGETATVLHGHTTEIARSYSPQTGTLQVHIDPAEVRGLGAQWSINEVDWYNSDDPPITLPADSYIIKFHDVTGWNTPGDLPVDIQHNQSITKNVTYEQQTGTLQVFIDPQGARDDGAQWRVVGGDWYNSGYSATLPIGTYTIQFSDVNGWNTPEEQSATVQYLQTTPKTGIYEQQTGTLQIFIEPQGARDAGAQWSINGTSWYNSGDTLTVPVGFSTVQFSPENGWSTPPNQSAEVLEGQTTTKTGTYSQQVGDLQVMIEPQGARDAGVQWSINGMEWYDNGHTLTLPINTYTVQFSIVAGWTTPASQSAEVLDGQTVVKTGTYIQQFGDLQVFLEPQGARDDGAQWSLDGFDWYDHGHTLTVPVATHTIQFQDITGWNTPSNQTADVEHNLLTTQTGTYTEHTGDLQVFIEPQGARDAGAQWSINGEDWYNDGHILTLPIGSYTVQFNLVNGWNPPASQSAEIVYNQVTAKTGTYVQQTGSLQVFIDPAGDPRNLGQWSVDGGASWNDHNDTIILSVGTYLIEFSDVTSWSAPPNQLATILANQTIQKTGTYSQQVGDLQVFIEPQGARDAGAQWSINGVNWYDSGQVITLIVDTYTVQFKTLSDWNPPVNQSADVLENQTTTKTGTYVEKTGDLQVMIEPQGARDAGAQWSINGSVWYDSSQSLTLPIGTYTVRFSMISGWNPPANQPADVLESQTTVKTGSYVQQTGDLQVHIEPQGARDAGAQWSINGFDWNNSGQTLTLPVDDYTVQFRTLSGWDTPANQSASIQNGILTTKTGTYVQQTGRLQVFINPQEVINAGAKWRVDGGAWQDSGAVVSGLTVGTHLLEFNDVAGWTKPANEMVTIYNNSTTSPSRSYTQLVGSLQVFIEPEGAQTDGAAWRVDGGAWHTSGQIVSSLAVGTHDLVFQDLPNWDKAADRQVQINNGETTQVIGVYEIRTGDLQVTITPQEAIDAGARWRVDNGLWQQSGATVYDLEVGLHTVEFLPVTDWQTPPNRVVDIFPNTLATANGEYTPPQTIILQINEFMASVNEDSGITDPQGEYEEWFEIYNPTDSPQDIGGMWLEDDNPDNRTQIPAGTGQTSIPKGGYLVLWADEDTGDGPLHVNFRLNANGDAIKLYDVDGTMLLDSVVFSNQILNMSYGRYPDGAPDWFYFNSASPGSTNDTQQTFVDRVADTKFSYDRGFYDSAIQVEITSATPGAQIFYTTNYEDPIDTVTATNFAYVGPISISQTTCLRAKAFKPGWIPTDIDTQTYIFVADVVNQSQSGQVPGPGWPSGSVNGQVINYGMDPDITVTDVRYADLVDDSLLAIPSISLVTPLPNLFDPSTGIYVNAYQDGINWERPVSAELIYPDGAEGFQINAGVRIRGGYSRSGDNPKHAFRLFFRSEYGDSKLRYPMFENEGVEEFDKIDLRTSQNYSWSFDGWMGYHNTFVCDVFSRDTQGATGQPYTRSRYYHLYLNGQYWGLYQTQERSEAAYAESYFGGTRADYDVVKIDPDLGYEVEATDGTTDAYNRLWQAAVDGFETDEKYYSIQGLNPDGTRNPALERLVDLDNVIDYMLITFYVGDFDGPVSNFLGNTRPNNYYGIYNREIPDGFKFFRHDGEHTWVQRDGWGYDRTGPFPAGDQFRYFNPQWLHQKLAEHPEYPVRMGDRAHKYFYNNGIMTPSASQTRFMNRATQVEMAIIAESARWGDSKVSTPFTKADWEMEIEDVAYSSDNPADPYHIPARTDLLISQLQAKGWYPSIDAPVFSIGGVYQHGGWVDPGNNQLSMDNPNGSGTIYYTTDGTDPRLPTATVASGTTLVTEKDSKRVLVPASDIGYNWIGNAEPFDDSSWDQVGDDNGALDCDGAGDYVEIGKTASELGIGGANPKSITAWVYTRAFNEAGIWDMGDYVEGQNFSLRTLGTTNNWRVQYWGGPDFDFVYDSLNKWVHFALVYDGAGSILYADGTNHASYLGTLNTSDVETMKIGRWSFNNDPIVYFDGVIDDVQLYDQVLDVTDVESIMNVGACPKTPVSRWQLNETSGTTAYDSVGSNNGTLYGDPAWILTGVLGAGGIGYETAPGDPVNFADLISHDLEAQMYYQGGSNPNANTSCYVRIPFTLNTDPSTFNFMTLRIRYDDGFIAYVNGQEIHRENYAGAPAWNSYADNSHDDAAARDLTSFKITDPTKLSALHLGENVLAIHGLNLSNSSTDFLISAELIAGEESPIGEIISPTAQNYTQTGPINLTRSTQVKARVLSDTQAWSALNDAIYGMGPVVENLRITELMYHPAGDPNAEFIEVMNIHPTDAINLALVRFTNGVEFEFPPMSLGYGQRGVVVKDQAAFETRYGTGINVVPGEYTGSLSNSGEEIDLEDALGTEIHDFDYDDGWYEVTDGLGFSLTIRDPYSTALNDWDEKDGWRASFANGGSPGEDDSSFVLPADAILVNELLAHADTEPSDWVEFYNTTNDPIDIGGWFISDNDLDLMKYEIEAPYVVPDGGYAVFYANSNFGPGSTDPGAHTLFAFSENGEKVYLTSGSGGALTGVYSTERRFYASEADVAFGHYVKSTGTDFVAMSSNSPSEENAYPKVGPVVINEIAYNPNSDGDAEFVEFLNVSGDSVTLYDSVKSAPWRFVDDWEDDTPGLEYFFPASPAITLANGEYFLLVKDEAAFEAVFLDDDDISTLGVQWREWGITNGSLNNGGEQPELQKPGDPGYYIRVDRVKYSDGSHPVGDDPWPTEPDDSDDYVLERIDEYLYGNDVMNWQADSPTPGKDNDS
jgi:CotH protein/lamin tail-like protein/concanavalin A-like lectin/glucanase superfamily protein/chitobiase/beta-hexosaminidase-like protein